MADTVEIIHTGDAHQDDNTHSTLNPTTGLSTAWESHETALTSAITHAINHQDTISAFLHNGDNFATGNPTQEALLRARETYLPLVQAGIPLVLLGGNHELIRVPVSQRTATETLGAMLAPYGEVHIVERRPELVRLDSGIQVAAFPWLSKSLVKQAVGMDEDVDLAQQDQRIAQYFIDTLGELSNQADTSAPFILASHVTIDDVRLESLAEGAKRGSETDINTVFKEPVIPRQGIEDSPVSYAALSHIHARQRMGTKCFYAGAPDRFTMTDADDPKSVNHVRINGDNTLASVDFIETQARAMHSISLESNDAENRLDALNPGALVRIELPAGESTIPESVRTTVTEAGARIVATKTKPMERVKHETVTVTEQATPEEALRAWYRKTNPEGVDLDYALKLAASLED